MNTRKLIKRFLEDNPEINDIQYIPENGDLIIYHTDDEAEERSIDSFLEGTELRTKLEDLLDQLNSSR